MQSSLHPRAPSGIVRVPSAEPLGSSAQVSIVSQRRSSTKGLMTGRPGQPRRRLRPLHIIAAIVLAILVAVGAALAVLGTSKASLVADSGALARVQMPLGGGTVVSVSAVTGPHSRRVPIELQGNKISLTGRIRAGSSISIAVVIRRPGWISWLTGKRPQLQLTVVAPVAKLTHTYITVRARAPLRVR